MSKTKLEIIQETAAFYNAGNRSVQEEDLYGEGTLYPVCKYFGPDGKRCAFSRCCVDSPEVNEFLMTLEKKRANIVLRNAEKAEIEVLREGYRGHDADFWNELQAFHDGEEYWNENGLSSSGKIRMRNLIEDWSEK